MKKSKPQPLLESFRKRSQTAHEPQPKGAELNWTNIKNFGKSPFKNWLAANGTIIGQVKNYQNLNLYAVW